MRQSEVKTMKTSLDYRNDLLCVLAEYEVVQGSQRTSLKEWYPVRPAARTEVAPLLGRPLSELDSNEGLYIDEEGNVFTLAEEGATKPIAVERSEAERKAVGEGQDVASREEPPPEETNAASGRATGAARPKARRNGRAVRGGSPRARGGSRADAAPAQQASPASITFARLNLRQKLAVVRRRIAYVQKRGHNPRFNYNYVTAADIAGAVGDLLAELGVVVVPRLESIAHEAVRPGRSEAEHVARVIMSYSFEDVDTAEAITVKVAGEGLDSGDKAPYKAMTGALKYALLQSFLLATGDDPEEERVSPTKHAAPTREGHSDRLIGADEVRELRRLIDATGTELERVLAYYKLASLEEMTTATYRRAVELLNRKRATQARREATHATN
jgi:hypothetical protein